MLHTTDIWHAYKYLVIANSRQLKVLLEMLSIPTLDAIQANLFNVLNLKRLNARSSHPRFYARSPRRR